MPYSVYPRLDAEWTSSPSKSSRCSPLRVLCRPRCGCGLVCVAHEHRSSVNLGITTGTPPPETRSSPVDTWADCLLVRVVLEPVNRAQIVREDPIRDPEALRSRGG